MSKQSGFMARMQAAADAREAHARRYGRIFQMDMVTLALGEMGWMPEQFKELDRVLTRVTNNYCRGVLDDAKDDKEIWYSKADLDRALKGYVGEDMFVPYEERYRGT